MSGLRAALFSFMNFGVWQRDSDRVVDSWAFCIPLRKFAWRLLVPLAPLREIFRKKGSRKAAKKIGSCKEEILENRPLRSSAKTSVTSAFNLKSRKHLPQRTPRISQR